MKYTLLEFIQNLPFTSSWDQTNNIVWNTINHQPSNVKKHSISDLIISIQTINSGLVCACSVSEWSMEEVWKYF